MKKNTLLITRDIIADIEKANSDLAHMLDIMNLNQEERRRIEDAILVTIDKINIIKKSNISDLQNHIDIKFIDKIFK